MRAAGVLRRLTDIESGDALGWGPVLAAVRQEFAAKAAVCMRVDPRGAGPELAFLRGSSDESLEEATRNYRAAMPSFSGPMRWWDAGGEAPASPPAARNQGLTIAGGLADDRAVKTARDRLEDATAPIGFTEQLRVLLYDRSRFLGWFGLLRTRSQPLFGPEDIRGFERSLPLVRRHVRFADLCSDLSLEAALGKALLADGFCAIFSEDGRLVEVSERAADWVGLPAFAERARVAIRAGRAQGMGALRLSLHRRYFVFLGPPAPEQPGNGASLSTRELEVARLAARGFSVLNAALQLGIREATAKTLLLRAYRKLEVHGRADLVLRMQSLGLL